MDVILSLPRGFCAGVVRAIDIVELCLKKFGPPVYVKHQIVHNKFVVDSLAKKGARTVEDVDEVPAGSVVIFSAHGSPPGDFSKARDRQLKVIDATCPLVTRVHNEAKKYSREGLKILLVGHKDHPEVRGTMGQSEMVLVDERGGTRLPDWERNSDIVILTQTTLSVDDTDDTVRNIKRAFPNSHTRDDICYATTNRQNAVKKLAGMVDLLLVIGSQNSSNCSRLLEVAMSQDRPAYLIDGPEDLDEEWLKGANTIGITSGASTPEILIDRVISHLAPDNVTTMDGIEENVAFSFPKDLV